MPDVHKPIPFKGISLIRRESEIFQNERILRILMDFSSKQKDFHERRAIFLGVKCPLVPVTKRAANLSLMTKEKQIYP